MIRSKVSFTLSLGPMAKACTLFESFFPSHSSSSSSSSYFYFCSSGQCFFVAHFVFSCFALILLWLFLPFLTQHFRCRSQITFSVFKCACVWAAFMLHECVKFFFLVLFTRYEHFIIAKTKMFG